MFAQFCLFLVLVGGDAFSVPDSRDDEVGEIQPEVNTHWGKWGRSEYCMPGSYAYGFKMNVGNRGSSDDTGANAIVLYCRPTQPGENDKIASSYENWGIWQSKVQCSGQSFLTGASIKSQPKQYTSDDTAVNNIRFECQNGAHLEGVGGSHGTWGSQANCPKNSAICGIKTRVEDFLRKTLYRPFPDNTALNEVIFFCCSI